LFTPNPSPVGVGLLLQMSMPHRLPVLMEGLPGAATVTQGINLWHPQNLDPETMQFLMVKSLKLGSMPQFWTHPDVFKVTSRFFVDQQNLLDHIHTDPHWCNAVTSKLPFSASATSCRPPEFPVFWWTPIEKPGNNGFCQAIKLIPLGMSQISEDGRKRIVALLKINILNSFEYSACF